MAEHRVSGPVAPEIVLQADIGGMTIAFTELVSGADEEKLNERLDLYGRAIARQRAKVTLTEKLVDLLAAQKTLASLPEREMATIKARAEERMRLRASFEAAHDASGRRSAFRLNDAQQKGLEAFDAQTAVERKKLDDERKMIEAGLPVLEAQIARLRGVIAGRDPMEALEVERETLAEAAE